MMGVEITLGEWLLMCVLGALVGLDSVSWPQAMWSRPIVAATVGGFVFGNPGAGFLAGLWLELVMSRHPPFGAARYPETGPAALTAGAAIALADASSWSALLGSVLVGWSIGWIGMHSLVATRRINARLVADPAQFGGQPAEVARRHLACVRLDATRAAVIVGTLLVPSVLAVRALGAFREAPVASSVSGLLTAIGLAGLTGIGARALGTRRRGWPALVLGATAGVLLAWGFG